ncbi:beta-1,4-galactosyltransferase 4-like protein, partial [Elysia marginata]
MYRCDPRGPLHFVAGVNKFQYKLIYDWLIGGVLGFTRQQFQKVNGFSNLYFGWGSEDDDMRYRIMSMNMTTYRRPKHVGLYDMIRHNRDKRWRPNNA